LDTPLGEVRVGRMPFHWGLGMFFNDGNSITSNSPGDYVDRAAVIVPFSDFNIIPAFDFTKKGGTTKYRDNFIATDNDSDGYALSIMLTKKESDRTLFAEKLLKENTVLEFGVLAMYSWNSYYGTTEIPTFEEDAQNKLLETTDASVWTLDGWFNLYYRNLSFKIEGAFVKGPIGISSVVDGTEKEIEAEMFALATETEYKIIPQKFHISLLAGLSSSDSDASHNSAWNLPGTPGVNGSAVTGNNSVVSNFRFHKDYDINSMVWKYIFGKFTSGFYTSIDSEYHITNNINISGGLTYSQAWDDANTLSYDFIEKEGKGTPIAVEPFFRTSFRNDAGLRAGIDYQLAIPLSGLNDADAAFVFSTYIGFIF